MITLEKLWIYCFIIITVDLLTTNYALIYIPFTCETVTYGNNPLLYYFSQLIFLSVFYKLEEKTHSNHLLSLFFSCLNTYAVISNIVYILKNI